MTRLVTFELDAAATDALTALEASGLSTEAAINTSIIDAARRFRTHGAVRYEVAILELDSADRTEMADVARFMASLRPALGLD